MVTGRGEREGFHRVSKEERPLFTEGQINFLQLQVNGVSSDSKIAKLMGGISEKTILSIRAEISRRLRNEEIEPVSLKRAISEAVWRGLVDTRHLPDRPREPLSGLETKVLALFTYGYNRDYICNRIGVGRAEVDIVFKRILFKLPVSKQNQAVAWAAREISTAKSKS